MVQFGTIKLNGPSGAFRVGSALDRRGLLRASAALGGSGADALVASLAGYLEFCPLSPRRFTPILGAGGGLLEVIEDAESRSTHGIGFLVGGVAVRVAGSNTITLRLQYGDSYKRENWYSVHLGFQFGI